jgi:uncharacterized membrane protein YkvA (DUF1232 family)
MPGLFRFGGWLKMLKDNALILYYAWKHPDTPAYVKGLLAVMLMYVFSPVDLLPDYLPLMGIADDVMLISVVIPYLTRLLPESVQVASQREGIKWKRRIPLVFMLIIICISAWIILALIGFRYILS